jgi:predicted ferric reductase
MAFEFALISRIGVVSSAFGQDTLLQFHRQMGVVAAALIVLHAVFVFRNGYPLEWLNPFSDGMIKWGVLAAYALAFLIVLSLARKRLGISYSWWQTMHWLLAAAIIVMGAIHVLQLGSFASALSIDGVWAVYLLFLIALTLRFRFVKPLMAWRRPWKVVQNIQEPGNSRTLVLRPEGHRGFTFEPGQFAWLNTGRGPFTRDQHPISFSSCAYDEEGREVSFTVKALGDWSGTEVPSIAPGRTIWIDGPYGVFTADQEQGPGYVLIAGGVGITPFYSLCRTFAERGDQRPIVLFYAGRNYEDLTFRDELNCLQHKMNLKVVYIVNNPPPDWTGETGMITEDVIRRHLPKQFKRMQYFVCGPPPMMDAMESMLPQIGVPAEFIHTERFDMI